jgi:putative hydrolases of HD superfamily
MISKLLAQKVFEAFSIQRWNDQVRPIDLNEMDKSAHKMIIAYFIGKYEEQNKEIDWDRIIHAGIFELLRKIVLSDIKAPVYRKIKYNYPEEFIKLNDWVIKQYEPYFQNQELFTKFKDYIYEKEDFESPSNKILKAAHKYSTYRELQIIKPLNPNSLEILRIEKELLSGLEPFRDLKGLQLLLAQKELFQLITLIEQLRYQTRWSHTPRIPKTSVLGHSITVAVYTFLLGYEMNISICPKRRYNNFFGALFHDLPEAVTRDIISPVKRATRDLPEIVKQIEDQLVQEKLYPLMDSKIKEEIQFFTENEFSDRVLFNNEILITDYQTINDQYNEDQFSPIDGTLIRFADEISALLEAYQSIIYGIKSIQIEQGLNYFLNMYHDTDMICGIDIRTFFKEFAN